MKRFRREKTGKKQALSRFVPPALCAAAYLAGLCFGAANQAALPPGDFDKLSAGLDMFFGGVTSYALGAGNAFFECALKYGKLAAGIWALCLFAPGIPAALALLFFRGAATGFTTAFFIAKFGLFGFYNSAALFLLQNAVIVPAYFYTLCSGMAYVSGKSAGRPGGARFNALRRVFAGARRISLAEYLYVLVIACACVALASLIEACVVPGLAGMR